MTWRTRVVSVEDYVFDSNAELDVFIELQRRGLTDHLETQKGFVFDPEVDGVHGTTVEFYWHPPYMYAAFLDGEQVHRGSRLDKDELVTRALQRRDIRVDRFRYRTPLSKRRKMEICDRIEEELRK